MGHKIMILPGDGIGPEVTTEVEKLIKFLDESGALAIETENGLIGGAAIDEIW